METMVVEGQNKPKIASKRMKLQYMMEEGEEDRISALPDSLILEILSRLQSTKSAIKTGTLSKRWKHLWTLAPSIYFHEYIGQYQFDICLYIDQTLPQCRQPKLKKFAVTTQYESGFESHVNNWIRYAISCNVEELSLMIWNEEGEGEFLLDQIFFVSSCFTALTLKGSKFNPIGAINWRKLRSLCIYYVKLDEDLIDNILCGSPLLETLIPEDCYGYRRLNITSKSVKKLSLYEYGYPDHADKIKINAPNILSLTIKADWLLWKLSLQNVSSLVKANLDYKKSGQVEISCEEAEEEMIKAHMLNLCHVKELKIGVICAKVLSRMEAKGFKVPSNIKFPSDSSDSDSVENEDL